MDNLLIPAMPVWGGIECTINRLNDTFYDQLDMNGYYKTNEAINAIDACNIKVLRFPVMWEKHQPSLSSAIDWTWAEGQLNLLKEKNIDPIIGLLHHGSGPAFTNLLADDFPELFAAYAAKVAAKFPWVNLYNPINEPLTTARFSGLYGLWYPHKKNDVSFIRILLNELKGIVLAMEEIRKVNPNARLVQTEDLAKTYSRKLLTYQTDFENERRWLTYDILTGRFDNKHRLWKYFMRLGIEEETLTFFVENPCYPNMLGANYYITSERFLDDRIEQYAADRIGGNTVHQYVDVEAIRIPIKERHGLDLLLEELWDRYKIPIAITEAHLHCSREEQLRWLQSIHSTALQVKEKGVDIRAITAWALLGSFGWNQLLTSFPGTYETGAFDNSTGDLRPTALAKLIASLNTNTPLYNHLTSTPGWWQNSNRYFVNENQQTIVRIPNTRPIIIVGKTGTLGQAFSKICVERNLLHYLLGRHEVDIANSQLIEAMVEKYNPWAIINAAGFVNIDKAENEKETCYRENTLGTQKLGIICQRLNIRLLTFSSDQVFDGQSFTPYHELCETKPLNIYGHSKLLSETFLNNVNPSALIVRTSALFGPWDKDNFLFNVVNSILQGHSVEASPYITVSPTYIPHLVKASLDLLIDYESGIWHLANKGALTWFDWAITAASRFNVNPDLVIPESVNVSGALKPTYSVLSSEKYALMPTLEDAMDEYSEAVNPFISTTLNAC